MKKQINYEEFMSKLTNNYVYARTMRFGSKPVLSHLAHCWNVVNNQNISNVIRQKYILFADAFEVVAKLYHHTFEFNECQFNADYIESFYDMLHIADIFSYRQLLERCDVELI